MIIRGASGLYSFLTSNGMTDREVTLRRLINCVIDLQTGCPCHKRADKLQKLKNCERIYHEIVRFIIPSISEEFLKKTTEREIIFLGEDGNIIKTISR